MRTKIVMLLLFTVFISSIGFTSCTKSKADSVKKTGNETQTVQDSSKNAEPIQKYTIIYYDVEQNKKITKPETFQGDSEFMLSHIIDRISDLTKLKIDYNYISNDAQTRGLTIDFKSGGSPVTGLGSAGEAAVLDSITETMFENFPEIDRVFFTCDKGEYSSGHVQLELGEAYRSRENVKVQ
jgi:hypothetical protein